MLYCFVDKDTTVLFQVLMAVSVLIVFSELWLRVVLELDTNI